MYSGQAQVVGNLKRHQIAGGEKVSTGVEAAHSDSMGRGFRVSLIPNSARRRQIERATQRGTKIPCPPRSYNEKHFFFWNQSVAAEVKDGPRRLKFVYGSLENGGSAMATWCDLYASLHYGAFAENSFILTMLFPWLNPEV